MGSAFFVHMFSFVFFCNSEMISLSILMALPSFLTSLIIVVSYAKVLVVFVVFSVCVYLHVSVERRGRLLLLWPVAESLLFSSIHFFVAEEKALW